MDESIDVNTLFGPLPSASTDLTLDELKTMMQGAAVGRACTLSTLGPLISPQVGNAATKAACGDNEYFIPVGTLNPMQFYGEASQVASLTSDGFCMVRFFPDQQGWPVDFAPFRQIVAALGSAGLPLMVDVDSPGQISTLAGVLSGFSGPVILCGVTDGLLAEAVACVRERATWHVEISGLLATGAIKVLAESAGIDRVLFGSGAPARPIVSVQNALRAAGLDQSALGKVLGGNARGILNLR